MPNYNKMLELAQVALKEGRPIEKAALDMTQATRLARAKEMGFDTSKVFYHGTPQAGFNEFDTYGKHGLYGMGSYFTDNPEIASTYTEKGLKKILKRGEQPSQGIYPTYLKMNNPIDMDSPANLEMWKKVAKDDYPEFLDRLSPEGKAQLTNKDVYKNIEDILSEQEIPDYEGASIMQEMLRDMGHDGVMHTGGEVTGGIKHKVKIPFDPEQIRSVNAKFDPSNSGSGNILAGIAGGIGIAGTINQANASPNPQDTLISNNIQQKFPQVMGLIGNKLSQSYNATPPVQLNQTLDTLKYNEGQQKFADFLKQTNPSLTQDEINKKLKRKDEEIEPGIEPSIGIDDFFY